MFIAYIACCAFPAVTGATKNSGQRCTAVKRILCQNKVADKFVEMALERAKKIKFGDPMNLKTDLGTVVNAEAAELFDKRVSKAEEDGAKILYHPGRNGALLPPIVVDNVDPKSELVLEETFGPVIPIIRVPNDDDEVMKISNSTAFGLSSGVCTNNFMRAKKYIQGLNVGTVIFGRFQVTELKCLLLVELKILVWDTKRELLKL